MLELRPVCEHCGKELPPHSLEARICSFECTFCAECVAMILHDVCPNCGGGFCSRPIRPARRWKDNNYLGGAPATTNRIVNPVDSDIHRQFSQPLLQIAPHER